jgi:hypothetical protein
MTIKIKELELGAKRLEDVDTGTVVKILNEIGKPYGSLYYVQAIASATNIEEVLPEAEGVGTLSADEKYACVLIRIDVWNQIQIFPGSTKVFEFDVDITLKKK